jgi:hypothetical protein
MPETLLDRLMRGQQEPAGAQEPAGPATLLDQLMGQQPPRATLRGGLVEAGRMATRGLYGVGADLLKFPGTLQEFVAKEAEERFGVELARRGPAATVLEQLGQRLEEALPKPRPEYQGGATGFFTQDVPAGIGSSLGFMSSVLFGGAIGLPASASIATTGAMSSFVSGYEEVADRPDVDEDRKWVYALLQGGMGLSEAVPLGRMLNRLNRRTGGGLRKVAFDAFTEAFEEAGQEGAQQAWSDFWRVALTPDEYEDLFTELKRIGHSMAVGAVSGGGVSVAVSGLGAVMDRIAPDAGISPQPAAPPTEEQPADEEATPDRPQLQVAGEVRAPGVRTTPEILASFMRGNVEQGLAPEAAEQAQVVTDPSLVEQELVRRGRAFGAEVALVDAGEALPAPAFHSDGLILLDRRASPATHRRHLLWHELVHRLARLRGLTFAQVYAAIGQADPEGLRRAQLAYLRQLRANRAARGITGPNLDRGARREEGLAHYVETIGGYVDLVLASPQKAVELQRGGILDWLGDAVVGLVNSVLGTNLARRTERRWAAWKAQATALGARADLDPRKATAGALLISEAWQSLRGSARRLEPLTPEQEEGVRQAVLGGPEEQVVAQLEGLGMAREEAEARAARAKMVGPPVGGAPATGQERTEPGAWPDFFGPSSRSATLVRLEEMPAHEHPKEHSAWLLMSFVAKTMLENEGAPWPTILQAREALRSRAPQGFGAQLDLSDRNVEEIVEAGVGLAARAIVRQNRLAGDFFTERQIFQILRSLYERQPNLAARTSESRRLQQFSTPIPLAYLVSRLAGVEPDLSVLDPAAGTGHLLLETTPASGQANEISEFRALLLRALGHETTTQDATKPFRETFDRIVANPPFGRLAEMLPTGTGGVTRGAAVWKLWNVSTKKIDHAIVASSLAALSPGGRAVFIIGTRKPRGPDPVRQLERYYQGPAEVDFFEQLHKLYAVQQHIRLSGDIYRRQGAAWPLALLVVDASGQGAAAVPRKGKTIPRELQSWEEIEDAFFDSAGRIVAPAGPAAAPERGGAPGEGTPGVGGLPAAPGGAAPGAGRPPGRRGAGRPPIEPGRPGGPGRGPGGPAQPGRPADTGELGPGAETPAGGPRGPGVAGGRPGGEPGRPEGAPAAKPGGVAGVRPPAGAELSEDELRNLIEGEIEGSEPPAEPGKPPDWAKGLDELFALEIDEERYQKARPHFERAIKDTGADITDPKDVVSKVVGYFRDTLAWPAERLKTLTDYLIAFVREVAYKVAPTFAAKAPQRQTQTLTEEIESNLSERQKAERAEGRNQVTYEPAAENPGLPSGTLAPVNLAGAFNAALARVKADVGDLVAYVAAQTGLEVEGLQSGRTLAAEQVDAVALAIWNHKKTGAAFIIGDQTGIGKGRAAAAMMVYAVENGMVPVFFTKAANLYADMYRDLAAIGRGDLKALMTNTSEVISLEEPTPAYPSGTMPSLDKAQLTRALEQMREGSMPKGYDAVFTTYSQMNAQGIRNRGVLLPPRYHALVGLAPKAFFVLDESHEAGGSAGARPKKDASGQPLFPRSVNMRAMLRNARGVYYSSATFSKNPHTMTLYYKTDIGRVVGSAEDLAVAVTRGGTPYQQVLTRAFGSAGQMLRRERDFRGSTYETHVSEIDLERLDVTADLVRSIQRYDLEMERVRATLAEQANQGRNVSDPSVGKVSIDRTPFTSIFHNLIHSILLSAKAKAVADHAADVVEKGIEGDPRPRSVVITSYRTFMSPLEEFMEEQGGLRQGANIGQVTFNQMFRRYLHRTRIFRRREAGSVVVHWVEDEELEAAGFPQLVELYHRIEASIGKADLSALPMSPIDAIRDRLTERGITNDEITGRAWTFPGGVTTRRRKGTAAKQKVIRSFNSGETLVVFLNQSGAEGISLHPTADLPKAGQRPRGMFVAEPAPDINIQMQLFGRIDRTGNLHKPYYALFATNMPAERRQAMMLERRMNQLNANVVAARKGALSAKGTVDFLNELGDEVAYELLSENPRLVQELQISLDKVGPGGKASAAQMLTARLNLLPLAEQEAWLSRIEREYQDHVETMSALGLNLLEARELDVKARRVRQIEVSAGDPTLSGDFGAPVFLERMDMARLSRPLPLGEVLKKVEDDKTTEASDLAVKYARSQIEEAERKTKEVEEHIATLERGPADEETDDAITALQMERDAYQSDIQRARSALTDVQLMLRNYKPGSRVEVRVPPPIAAGAAREAAAAGTSADSSDYEIFYGVIAGVRTKPHAENLLAPSSYEWAIYTTESNAALRVSGSKIKSGKVQLLPAVDASGQKWIEENFDKLAARSREERWVMTGNLVAAYIEAGFRGQITMFTTEDGNVEHGIILPNSFSPARDLGRQPIRMTADQAFRFARESDNSFRTSDLLVAIYGPLQTGEALWKLRIRNRGGEGYYLNTRVAAIVGEFESRRGKKHYSRMVSLAQLEEILPIWEAEAGARYELPIGKSSDTRPEVEDIARRVTGRKKITEEEPRGSMALRITAAQDAEVRRYYEAAREEGEATGIGQRPSPIAGTSEDPDERALQRAVREVRADAQEVRKRSRNRADAEYRLYANFAEEKKRLLAKIERGEALDAVETEEVNFIKTEAGIRAIQNGDRRAWVEAERLNWAYQDARREAGRTLGQIRDPIFDRLRTGREKMVDILSIPSRDIRRKIARLREEWKNPDTPVARRGQIDAEIDKLLMADAARGSTARQKLVQMGIDPATITNYHFDDPVIFSRIARVVASAKSSKWDWYVEYMLSAMLMGPLTQKANLVGNTAYMLWDQHLRRMAEAMVNVVVRDPESATFREVYHFYRAMLPAIAQAGHYFLLAYQTQLPAFELDLGRFGVPLKGGVAGKLEAPGEEFIDSEDETGRYEGAIGERGVRAPVLPGFLGTALRFGSLTSLLAFDEAAKALVGTSEAHALAFRQAWSEGARGAEVEERMHELLADSSSKIHERSLIKARKVTFQEQHGQFTKIALSLRRALDEVVPGGLPVGTQLIPFVKTPVGIFKAGLATVFAPVQTLWRFGHGRYRGNRTDFVRDFSHTLLSMIVTGAVLHLLFARDDDDLPLITGSAEPEYRKRQFQYRTAPPYHVKLFGKYWDYRRVEPASVTIATLVDVGTALQEALKSRDQDAIASSAQKLLTSIGDQSKDKTFLRTIGDLYEAVFNRERNERLAPRIIQDQLFTKLIPNIVRQPLRETDPFIRASTLRKYEDKGPWEAGMSSMWYQMAPARFSPFTPPPRYDTWGRPIERFDPSINPANRLFWEIALPVPSRPVEEKALDLDRLLLRYNRRVEHGDFGPEESPYYAKPPDYWYVRGGKTYYWDDQEYARLGQESGTRALSILSRSRLNYQDPTPKDIARIKEVLAESRRRVRMSLIRGRRTDEQ